MVNAYEKQLSSVFFFFFFFFFFSLSFVLIYIESLPNLASSARQASIVRMGRNREHPVIVCLFFLSTIRHFCNFIRCQYIEQTSSRQNLKS